MQYVTGELVSMKHVEQWIGHAAENSRGQLVDFDT